MRRGRALLFTLLLLASPAALSGAYAADWPAHPVRIVIPFGAGSATDIIPRIVFDQVGRDLGQ